MEIRFVSSRDTAAVEQDAELPAPVARMLDFSGRVLRGRYRLRHRLGVGGMGAVYEARDQVFEAAVAVKLIHPELARDPEFRRRFLQEARLGVELRHRHCVAVTDVGETDDGVLFLVMERLEGEALDAVLAARGPLPWRRVCTIAAQLCDALAEAHDRGVVHRDIKPANCFLVRTEGGGDFVKLLDLGLAKLLPAHRGLARGPRGQAAKIVGTPEYMSPEQALGLAHDHRVDIYALGATMYKLLTGQVPFVDSSPAMVLRRQVGEAPRPLRERAPDVPPALEAVVLRALAKRPDDRYPSARELARAIRGARELAEFDLAEIVAEEASVRAPVVRPLETRRAAAGLGVAGVALAVAALASLAHALLARREAEPQPERPPPAASQLAPGTGPVRPALSAMSLGAGPQVAPPPARADRHEPAPGRVGSAGEPAPRCELAASASAASASAASALDAVARGRSAVATWTSRDTADEDGRAYAW